MRHKTVTAAILSLFLLPAIGAPAAPGPVTATRPIPHEPPIQEFDSPDGVLVIWVAEGHDDVALSVTDKNKHELASDEHRFNKPPHGFGFVQGGWTADSQYFVYSAAAWGDSLKTWPVFSVYIFSRGKNAFLDPASHIGVVASPKFELMPPDVVGIEIVDSAMHSTKKVTLHLSQLTKD